MIRWHRVSVLLVAALLHAGRPLGRHRLPFWAANRSDALAEVDRAQLGRSYAFCRQYLPRYVRSGVRPTRCDAARMGYRHCKYLAHGLWGLGLQCDSPDLGTACVKATIYNDEEAAVDAEALLRTIAREAFNACQVSVLALYNVMDLFERVYDLRCCPGADALGFAQRALAEAQPTVYGDDGRPQSSWVDRWLNHTRESNSLSCFLVLSFERIPPFVFRRPSGHLLFEAAYATLGAAALGITPKDVGLRHIGYAEVPFYRHYDLGGHHVLLPPGIMPRIVDLSEYVVSPQVPYTMGLSDLCLQDIEDVYPLEPRTWFFRRWCCDAANFADRHEPAAETLRRMATRFTELFSEFRWQPELVRLVPEVRHYRFPTRAEAVAMLHTYHNVTGFDAAADAKVLPLLLEANRTRRAL